MSPLGIILIPFQHFRTINTAPFYLSAIPVIQATAMDEKKIPDKIPATVREINRRWTSGWQQEQFRQYIRPDAVAIVYSEPGWLEGRAMFFLAREGRKWLVAADRFASEPLQAGSA